MEKSSVKIIYFYLDGCYYCNQFNPTWDKLCEKVTNVIQTIKYSAEDIEKETAQKIIKAYGKQIEGFPTILININNIYYEYNGERKVDSILDFILENLNKNDRIYEHIKKNTQKIYFEQNTTPELTYFYMNSCDYCKEFEPTWNELCNKLDNNLISTNKFEKKELEERETPKRIIIEYGKNIERFPTLLLKVNNNIYNYNKERTLESIINFIASKLNENDKLYKFIINKYSDMLNKNMIGGNINNINYRNKYKKYKQMYANLAIKYNELKYKKIN